MTADQLVDHFTNQIHQIAELGKYTPVEVSNILRKYFLQSARKAWISQHGQPPTDKEYQDTYGTSYDALKKAHTLVQGRDEMVIANNPSSCVLL